MNPAEKLRNVAVFIEALQKSFQASGQANPGHIQVNFALTEECETFRDLQEGPGVTLVYLENPSEPQMPPTMLGVQPASLPEVGLKTLSPEAPHIATLVAQMGELRMEVRGIRAENTVFKQQVQTLGDESTLLKQEVKVLKGQNAVLIERNIKLEQQVGELAEKVQIMHGIIGRNHCLAMAFHHDMMTVHKEGIKEMVHL